jgi:hypothetical protein
MFALLDVPKRSRAAIPLIASLVSPATPRANRPSAAAKTKKRIPLLTCVYHRYTLPSMNVVSAARPPLQRLLNEPRLAHPRGPAPAHLPPPAIQAFYPLHSGAGILPAGRQRACPVLARHASEKGCKPPALNNRPLKWASERKSAEKCGKVRKKIKKVRTGESAEQKEPRSHFGRL